MKRFSSLRRIGILLLVLTLVMGLAISASAATMTQDGVKVTVTPDKDKYEANEKIKPDIKVENLNDFDIKDVKVEVTVPSGYEVSGDKSVTYATVKAGEGKQPAVTIAAKPVVTPSTGDTTPIFLWGGLLFLVAALLVGMLIFFHKGNKKIMSIILAVVMVVGMIPVAVFAADVTRSMTLTETVTVDTKKADITVKVTYTIPAQDEPEDPTEGTEPGEGTTAGTTEPTTGNTTAPTTGGDVTVPEDPNAIYVSAAAKVGQGDGSFNNPYANMNEAKAAIRKIKANGDYPEEGITVYFREGKYIVTETILFEKDDSGEEGAPVVYTAYNDEEVMFVGGIDADVSEFSAITDTAVRNRLVEGVADDVLQIDLAALGITDYGIMSCYGHSTAYFIDCGIPIPQGQAPELFFNNESMTLSRYPNEDWTYVKSVVRAGSYIQSWSQFASGNTRVPRDEWDDPIICPIFEVEDDVKARMSRWLEAEDPWVYGKWEVDFSDQSMPVAVFDPEAGTVETGIASGKKITRGRYYYFYNMLEELDVPGEYYINRDTGILYFYPPQAEGTVTLSLLDGAMFEMNGAHDIEIVGIQMKAGRGLGIATDYAENIKITDCEISKFAERGIAIINSKNVTVNGCHIYDMGAGGIGMGYDKDTAMYEDMIKNLTSMGLVVENCEIHNVNRISQTYAPPISVGGNGTIVRNNKIYDATHAAIIFGGNDILIENNEIFDVLQNSGDMGVIYGGNSRQEEGQVIRNNYIHDVYSTAQQEYYVFYVDDTKDGVTIESNLVVNFGGASALMINGGWANTFRNNIIINSEAATLLTSFGTRGEDRFDVANHEQYELFREVYEYEAYKKYPHWEEKLPAVIQYNAPKYNVIKDNVIINVELDAMYASYMDSMTRVLDENTLEDSYAFSLYDVGFANIDSEAYTVVDGQVKVSSADFTLREDSVIYEKIPDFKPIDLSKVGLYGGTVGVPIGPMGPLVSENAAEEGDLLLFADDFSDGDISDWGNIDQTPEGCTVQVNNDKQLEVSIASNKEMTITNDLFEAYAGKLALEWDYKVELNDALSLTRSAVSLQDENGEMVLCVAVSGRLFAVEEGNTDVYVERVCEKGKIYRVRVILDTETDTYDMYIDNEKVISGRNLVKPVTAVSKLAINVKGDYSTERPDEYYDTVYFDNILVMKAEDLVLVYDDFNDGDVSDWGNINNVDLSCKAEVNDAKQFEITVAPGKQVIVTKEYTRQKGAISVEFDYTVERNGNSTFDAYVAIGDKLTGSVLNVGVRGTKFSVMDRGDGAEPATAEKYTTAKTCADGQTYRVKIVIDPASDCYDLYIDGEKIVDSRWLRNNASLLENVYLDVKGVSTGSAKLYIDNLLVRKTAESVDAPKVEEPVEGTALLEDNFDDGDLSDWAGFNSIDEACSATVNADKWLEVTNAPTKQVIIAKSFAKAQAGNVSYEWDYKVNRNGSTTFDAGIVLQDKAQGSILNIAINGTAFRVYDGGDGEGFSQQGFATTAPCVDGQTYKIKVVVDPAKDVYDLYVDGERIITARKLRKDATLLSGLNIDVKGHNAGANPTVYFDNIVAKQTTEEVGGAIVNPNVLLQDDFSDGDASDWGNINSINEACSAVVNADKQFEIKNAADAGVILTQSFDAQSGKVSFEWSYKVDRNGNDKFDAGIVLQDKAQGSILNIASKGGIFTLYDGGNGQDFKQGDHFTTTECKDGQTYKVRIVVDAATDLYDMYVDGMKIVGGRKLRKDASLISGFNIDVKAAGKDVAASTVWFDDFIVKKTTEEVGAPIEEPEDPEISETPAEGALLWETFTNGMSKWSANKPEGCTIDVNASKQLKVSVAPGATDIYCTYNGTRNFTGKFSVEYDFMVNNNGGAGFEAGILLRSGGTFLAVSSRNGKFNAAYSGTDAVCNDNQVYKVKILVDLEEHTFEFYLDGSLIKSGTVSDSVTACTDLWFVFKTHTGTANATAIIDNLVVMPYTEEPENPAPETPEEPENPDPQQPVVLLSENFSGGTANWTISDRENCSYGVNAAGALEISLAPGASDIYCIYNGTTDYTGKFAVEYDLEVDRNGGEALEVSFVLRDASGTFMAVAARNGAFTAAYNSAGAVCNDKQLYKVKVIVDMDADTYAFYLNGELVKSGNTIKAADVCKGVWFIVKGNTGTANAKAIIDNLTITAVQ